MCAASSHQRFLSGNRARCYKAELNTNPRQHRFANAMAVRVPHFLRTNHNSRPPRFSCLTVSINSTSVRSPSCEVIKLLIEIFEDIKVQASWISR